jgi:hypothetical protein
VGVAKALIQARLAGFLEFRGKTRTTLHLNDGNVDKFRKDGAKYLNFRGVNRARPKFTGIWVVGYFDA